MGPLSVVAAAHPLGPGPCPWAFYAMPSIGQVAFEIPLWIIVLRLRVVDVVHGLDHKLSFFRSLAVRLVLFEHPPRHRPPPARPCPTLAPHRLILQQLGLMPRTTVVHTDIDPHNPPATTTIGIALHLDTSTFG